MTQPFPEPLHFNPPEGSDPSNSPDLLGGRRGIVAVLVAPEAHASGWASQATVALAEASVAAGHPTGLVDLAFEDPRLHTAASVASAEGLTDAVLFGASLDRISQWSPAGARIVTAGTLVADNEEVLGASGWADVAREVAEGGCVLAYLPAESIGTEAALRQAADVIVLRHAGEEVQSLLLPPSLVLEPIPEVAETAPPEDEPVVDELEAEEDTSFEVEVTLDLDDVAADSDADAAPMFATPRDHVESDQATDSAVDVSGLDAEPAWPDFAVPLVVQDPGDVDPVEAAASGGAVDLLEDSGLSDIVSDEPEVLIVSDDMGMGEQPDLADEVAADLIEGLVDSGSETLNPAGESIQASADAWAGLEESLDVEGPVEALEAAAPQPEAPNRLADPWGEPPEPALAAPEPDVTSSSPPPVDVAEPVDGPDPIAAEAVEEPLPWDKRRESPEVVPEPEVPLAHVTRTRTRTRTKGPRPFLLILFLLLIVIVVVFQWLGLLDVAGLDFLRGDSL